MECTGHLAHDGEGGERVRRRGKEREMEMREEGERVRRRGGEGERERDGDEGRGRGVEGKEEGTLLLNREGSFRGRGEFVWRIISNRNVEVLLTREELKRKNVRKLLSRPCPRAKLLVTGISFGRKVND